MRPVLWTNSEGEAEGDMQHIAGMLPGCNMCSLKKDGLKAAAEANFFLELSLSALQRQFIC